MSPVVIIGISPSESPPEPESISAVDPNLLHASIGQTHVTFRADPRLGITRTLSERLELKEQIPDPEYQSGREILKQRLRQDPHAISREQLLSLAEGQNFFTRFADEFAILVKLGYPPFPERFGVSAEAQFGYYDDQMRLQRKIADNFCNVSEQPVLSAIYMDAVCELLQISGEKRERLVGDALLLKASKPWEIIDRWAATSPEHKKQGINLQAQADSEPRMTAHVQRLVQDGILEASEGERIFKLASHTVGTGGFQKFLRIDANGTISIVGDAHFQLLPAFDDCTIVLDPAAAQGLPGKFIFGYPADKMVVISGRRGDGILGSVLAHDPERADGVPKSIPGSSLTGEEAMVGTMGAAQCLLSEAILSYYWRQVRAGTTLLGDPLPELFAELNRRVMSGLN